MMCIENEGGLH